MGDICAFDPQITVTDTNPTPPSFPASSTPINVTLGAGDYNVTEEGFVAGLQSCFDIGFEGGQQTALENVFICTNFTEDCSGDISAGESLACEIENTFLDFTVPPTTETLTVIKNVDCQANSTICANNPIQPSNFTVVIEDNNPSQNNFPGSSTGTMLS